VKKDLEVIMTKVQKTWSQEKEVAATVTLSLLHITIPILQFRSLHPLYHQENTTLHLNSPCLQEEAQLQQHHLVFHRQKSLQPPELLSHISSPLWWSGLEECSQNGELGCDLMSVYNAKWFVVFNIIVQK
jgi:hypothetical protein